jgi:hypothetical protein
MKQQAIRKYTLTCNKPVDFAGTASQGLTEAMSSSSELASHAFLLERCTAMEAVLRA